jgi:hypothetical protein
MSPGHDDAQAEAPTGDGRSLIRPWMRVGARTPSTEDDFDVTTLVVAREPAPARTDGRELGVDERDVLAQCRKSVSIAELAGRLRLPVPVVKVLVGDLRRSAYVFTSSPKLDDAGRPSVELM